MPKRQVDDTTSDHYSAKKEFDLSRIEFFKIILLQHVVSRLNPNLLKMYLNSNYVTRVI